MDEGIYLFILFNIRFISLKNFSLNEEKCDMSFYLHFFACQEEHFPCLSVFPYL